MNERIKITYKDLTVDAAISVAKITVSIAGSGGYTASMDLAPGATEVLFTSIPAGDYSASAAPIDGNGNVIGTPATTTFSVVGAPATITIQVPDTLTASQE